MTHSYTGGQASLWIQADGPNTQPQLLGCHGIGDIDEGLGDIELFYCPDPAAMDRFIVRGSVQGTPDPVTVTVTGDVTDTLDALETVNCPVTLFVHKSKNGRRDVFSNYDRTFVLRNARVTSRSLTNLAAQTPDDNDRSAQSFELSADQLLRPMRLTISRQTITEVNAINDITFCNDEQCRTDDSPATRACQTGYAVADNTAAATANVLATADGSSWAATAADPFSTNEIAVAVECFDLGRNEIRVLVACGTTAVAGPARIAYSDDGGTTWTAVNVGAVNGQYVATRHSLFAVDKNAVWVGTDDGYIYKSEDSGVTWVAQESGNITAGAWNAISFSTGEEGWAGGDSNALARTIDGGDSWSTIAGPSAKSGDNIVAVDALDRNRAWIGYDDGTLFYTLDGGTSWYQRTFSGSGVGSIKAIKFTNDLTGYLVRDNASPVGNVLFTVDGGYTWETITTPTNTGLNAIYPCGPHSFFLAGEASGGTGFIAKAIV